MNVRMVGREAQFSDADDAGDSTAGPTDYPEDSSLDGGDPTG